MKTEIKSFFRGIKLKNCLVSLLGSVILSFGMYNIHSIAYVTEGGTPGFTLLINNIFGISPSITGFILNTACYALGIKTLGRTFLIYSAVSTAGFSLSYKIFELFPRIYPEIADHPLIAAVLGAVFVGVGVGLCVRMGGAPCGDDALAMSIAKRTKLKIQWVYLISDLTVLLLSLTYIPLKRIIYSLFTVILSGQIIGLISKEQKKKSCH